MTVRFLKGNITWTFFFLFFIILHRRIYPKNHRQGMTILATTESKHGTDLAILFQQPEIAPHSFKTRLVKCQQFWGRTPYFSFKCWCLSPPRLDKDWKHFKQAGFPYVLSKEQYLNFENSSSSKWTSFAQKSEKQDNQCRRNIRIKKRQKGDSPQLSSNLGFSFIHGFETEEKGQKKMDGVQGCLTDGQ